MFAYCQLLSYFPLRLSITAEWYTALLHRVGKYRYTSRRRQRQRHLFLTWALGGHEWSASHSSHFDPGEMSPVSSGCMLCRPRVCLGAIQMRKLPCPYWESRPGSSADQPVVQSLYRMSYPGFLKSCLRWCMLAMYICYCIPCRLLLFVYWHTRHVIRRGFFFVVFFCLFVCGTCIVFLLVIIAMVH